MNNRSRVAIEHFTIGGTKILATQSNFIELQIHIIIIITYNEEVY
jgi:hypothetical protein